MSFNANKFKATECHKAGFKKYTVAERLSVEELRKKYEPMTKGDQKSTTVEHLKKKYDDGVETAPTSPKESKVKQMTSMFNSKVNQIINRASYQDSKYSIAGDAKPPTEANLPKPWPMPRVNGNKEMSPIPSPRTKSESKANLSKPWPMSRDNNNKEKSPTPSLGTKPENKTVIPKAWPMPKANSWVKTSPTVRLRTNSEPKANPQKSWSKSRENSCKETTPTEIPETNLPKAWPMPTVNSNKEKSAVVSPRTKAVAKIPANSVCFAVEESFSKLSVKDKAHLYSQFISDMYKRNPRLGKDAQIIEDAVVNEANGGEVVSEKQTTVKDLREALEARCSFPKQFVSPLALQYVNTLAKNNKAEIPQEFDNLDGEEKPLAATQPNSNETKKLTRRARSLSRSHTNDEQTLKELGTIEPSTKRANDQMRSYLPIEAYAPPKKIRRTRAEVLTSPVCSKNQELQNLFFTWLKETNQDNEEEAKQGPLETKCSTIDHLLQGTIDKLETSEMKQNLDDTFKKVPLKIKSTSPEPTLVIKETEYISTSPSSKPSETEESESGLTPLSKISSEESQADNQEKESETSGKVLVAAKFIRPLRKKKLRRSLAWKKEAAMEEAPRLGSTDSDSDSKLKETKAKNKLIYLQATQGTEKPFKADDSPSEPSFEELDKSFLKEVNSPRKIKSAYTLTIFSPTPGTEETGNDDLDGTLTNETTYEADHIKYSPYKGDNRSITDSYIDQGFETGSNDTDSPIRAPRKSDVKKSEGQKSEPLFIQLPRPPCKTNEALSGCSTPFKGHTKQTNNFDCSLAQQQQVISPIISLPMKSRRKFTSENEPSCSSYTMEVIREDQLLEHYEITSPRKFTDINSSHVTMPDLSSGKTSQYWIKCGVFCISLDIFYNTADRVRLLYEIFSQKSYESRDIFFGIDDHKFSIQNCQDQENITKHYPKEKDCSHYWFSTGDMAVPFSGKFISGEEIQRLFEFVKANVEQTGILRFGVDKVEFSNVPEFWSPSPRFSMESNYSMLVGLQSGNSNGLEGRSKFAWPNRRSVKVSDLDESDDCNDEDMEENESCRLSFSPFGNNSYDLMTSNKESPSVPHNNEDIKTPDSFLMSFENESLDLLFEENYDSQEKLEDNNNPNNGETPTSTVPEMLCTLQSQQQRLSEVQERLSIYCKTNDQITHDALDALKGTPEYVKKLKSIVADIIQISNTTGFMNSSVEQLEYYMFYLSRYADICLHDCSDHMDKVLDALMEKRTKLTSQLISFK